MIYYNNKARAKEHKMKKQNAWKYKEWNGIPEWRRQIAKERLELKIWYEEAIKGEYAWTLF